MSKRRELKDIKADMESDDIKLNEVAGLFQEYVAEENRLCREIEDSGGQIIRGENGEITAVVDPLGRVLPVSGAASNGRNGNV